MAWLLKSGRRKCLLSVVECQIPVFESFKIIDPPGKFSPKLLSAFGNSNKKLLLRLPATRVNQIGISTMFTNYKMLYTSKHRIF